MKTGSLASFLAYLTIAFFYMAFAGAINVVWLKYGFWPAFAIVTFIAWGEHKVNRALTARQRKAAFARQNEILRKVIYGDPRSE